MSRRYPHDLIDEAVDVLDGVRVREATDVRTSTGVEHKKKALFVDCEQAHTGEAGVNQFTTGMGVEEPQTAAARDQVREDTIQRRVEQCGSRGWLLNGTFGTTLGDASRRVDPDSSAPVFV